MPTREDVRRWRQRAEECRTVADAMKGSAGRKNLLAVAEAYDKMVERAANFGYDDEPSRPPPRSK